MPLSFRHNCQCCSVATAVANASLGFFLNYLMSVHLCEYSHRNAAKNDYLDSIDIAGSTIAILLLLWTTIAILLWCYCLKHSCLFEGEN